ncbi:hypothetical protein LTR04_004936 [Oleoguttula sp. CCFEE 6159]|nr:hypothetical protein LTR04_004936 [Oleoguttula sp. CCFEE 6159]
MQPIKRGTRIISEPPLLAIPAREYSAAQIESQFLSLSVADQNAFLSLYSAHEENHGLAVNYNGLPVSKWAGLLLSTFQTNDFAIRKDDEYAAVFFKTSHINHSCIPNASFAWNNTLERSTVHAVNDIAAGEEITMCYCPPYHGREDRKMVQLCYGFECTCPACDPEAPGAEATEQRRLRMEELADILNGSANLDGSYEEADARSCLPAAIEMAELHVQEGLVNGLLVDVYTSIASMRRALGTYTAARAAYREALLALLHAEGADSPRVKETMDSLRAIKGLDDVVQEG